MQILFGVFFINVSAAASPDRWDVVVLSDPQEALARAFENKSEVCSLKIDDEMVHYLEGRLHRILTEKSVDIRRGEGPGGKTRYAVVTNEIGKYRPFTFLIVLDSDLRVSYLELLIYRESHGYEIARKRFLSQYKGKDLRDKLRPTKDIVNIAGATLSVRGVSHGVKKVLAILNYARDHALCPFEKSRSPSPPEAEPSARFGAGSPLLVKGERETE